MDDRLLQTCQDVLSDCFILRDLPGLSREHADFITDHLVQPLQVALAAACQPATEVREDQIDAE